jgi:hypothetical protein
MRCITVFERAAGFLKRANKGIGFRLQPHVLGVGQGKNLHNH